ncbi:hypothetical protein ACPPVO_18980 [Dactylosporangium sp. McL0621]|uniref:hypothetical protein n=1 Tax=Dactylosporangium sp. McL0621 TaxID=3415678 RepID=UPI003CF5D5C6
MDEQDFRASLRDALDHSNVPPSMSPGGALQAGRRAARLRMLATGAAGAGLLAAFTALGLVVATTGSGAQQAAGPGTPSVAAPPGSGTPTVAPGVPGGATGSETKPVWPTGPDGSPQSDRTARAGKKADAAVALAKHVSELLPAGYTAVASAETNLVQAQFEDKVGGKDAWSYLVATEIRKGDAAGQLIVEVYEPGLRTGATPCDLKFWSAAASCRIVSSGGRSVAVATGGEQDDRIANWSAYQYPDGTVVFVAQSKSGNFLPGNSAPSLTALPFDDEKLAALALDPALHIVA